MPSGLWLRTRRQLSKRKYDCPERHTFIITREDGSRLHGLALLFPVPILHDNVKEAVCSLQDLVMGGDASRTEWPATTTNADECTRLFDPAEDALFTVRAIGLLSRYPFIHGLFGWLEDLWASVYLQSSSIGNNEGEIEACVAQLLYETSLPNVGHFAPFCGLFRRHFGYYPALTSPINTLLNGAFDAPDGVELPLFEYPLIELMRLIPLDDLVRLFVSVLMENRIIMFSTTYSRLMLVAEGITSLLLPFVWSHVYAPILPRSLVHFVDAPLPYIMGIKQCARNSQSPGMYKYTAECTGLVDQSTNAWSVASIHEECHQGCVTSIDLASEANVCYVYVDEGLVIASDEVPQLPNADHLKQSLVKLFSLNTCSKEESPFDTPVHTARKAPTAPVLRPRPPSDLGSSRWLSRVRLAHYSQLSIHLPNHGHLGMPTTQKRSALPSCSTPLDAAIERSAEPVTFEIGSDDSINSNPTDPHVQVSVQAATSIVSRETFPAYTNLLHWNTAIRLLFLRHFAHIFRNYDKFLVNEPRLSGGDAHNIGFGPNENSAKLISGLHVFDKVGFLSDQPETHLPFLSAFLETQMFASFLDARVNRMYLNTSLESIGVGVDRQPAVTTNLILFDHVIAQLGDNTSCDAAVGPKRRPETQKRQMDSMMMMTRGSAKVPLPDLLTGATSPSSDHYSQFPLELASSFPSFQSPIPTSSHRLPTVSSTVAAVRQKDSCLGQFSGLVRERLCAPPGWIHAYPERGGTGQPTFPSSVVAIPPHDGPERACPMHLPPTSSAPVSPPALFSTVCSSAPLPIGCMSTPAVRATNTNTPCNKDTSLRQDSHAPSNSRVLRSFAQSHQLAGMQQNGMAQTNWDFVDTLLEECKHRTKRMVLKKMGHEAVELGHCDPSVSVVEENTLVSGLCDLLERIWSHGLNQKSGKSALWSHLVHYTRRRCAALQTPNEMDRQSVEPVRRSSSSTSSSCGSSPTQSTLLRRSQSSVEKAEAEQSTLPRRNDDVALPTVISLQQTLPDSTVNTPIHPGTEWNAYYRGSFDSGPPPEPDRTRAASVARFDPVQQSSTLVTPSKLSTGFFDWRNKATIRNLPQTASARSPLVHRPSLSTASSFGDSGSASITTATTTVLNLTRIFGHQLLDRSLIGDVRAVQGLPGVKTDIGLARAFVRLALERKLLSAHLTRLLTDVKLLRKLYSRYAFLRCEEEREQFLVHLLSLNAVDYYSFTRMLTQALLVYKVFIFAGRKHGFPSTANAWIRLHGHLGQSPVIQIPRGESFVGVKLTNLGILSLIQVGHDNAGPAPKWYIELIMVHCEVSNHLYVFPCGHWLGRTIEDGALERLLIGERIPLAEGDPRFILTGTPRDSGKANQKLPNRFQLPTSITRRPSDFRNLSAMVIYEQVANAVNQLLKYYCKAPSRPGAVNLTGLWCGEQGLVTALYLVFTYGFRSNRLFQRRLYVWDYLEKVSSAFAIELGMPMHSNPPSPAVSRDQTTNDSQQQRLFSTRSLPRPTRGSRIVAMVGSLTPKLLHPSPSLYAVQDRAGDGGRQPSYASSQPNSPAPPRVLSAMSPLHTFDQLQQHPHSMATLTPGVMPVGYSQAVNLTAVSYNSMALLRQSATKLVVHVQRVTRNESRLGKEGQFQRFICRAVREHLLSRWFAVLALSPITSQMYEPKSFFLNHDLRQALQSLMTALDEFDFPLEPVLVGDG